jgi:gas vesicle protein
LLKLVFDAQRMIINCISNIYNQKNIIMSRETNSGKGFLFLLGGVLIGAAAGILFAPDKGTRTRRRIGRRVLSVKDAAISKFDALVNQAEVFVDDLRESAADFKDAADAED